MQACGAQSDQDCCRRQASRFRNVFILRRNWKVHGSWVTEVVYVSCMSVSYQPTCDVIPAHALPVKASTSDYPIQNQPSSLTQTLPEPVHIVLSFTIISPIRLWNCFGASFFYCANCTTDLLSASLVLLLNFQQAINIF